MTLISYTKPVDGATGSASDVTNPLDTIYNDHNGNIDNTNIAAGANIAGSKLADSSIYSTKLATGAPVQMIAAAFTAVSSGTTVIPQDDTIPQITEGTEFMTLAITPKSATNMLVIEVFSMVSYNGAAGIIGAIFQDATSNALAVGDIRNTANGELNMLSARHIMAAGTTSATTFRFRVGGDTAGTVTFNGSSTARLFGATTKSTMVITEYNT